MPERFNRPMGETSAPREKQWKEKHREMLKTLKQRVDFVIFLMNKSEEADSNGQNFKQKIEKIWNEGFEIFGVDYKRSLLEYEKLLKDLKALHTEQIKKIPENVSDEEYLEISQRQDYLDLDEKIDQISEHRKTMLKKYDQLGFLDTMQIVVKKLLAKHEIIDKIPDDPPNFAVEELVKIRKAKINFDSKKVIRIDRSPFSLSYIVEADEYERNFGDKTAGIHFSGTPFNVIRECDEVKMKGTIHHENIHNLTDGVVRIGNPIDKFEERLDRYQSVKKYNDKNKHFENTFLHSLVNPRSYIDDLHGEIIAAFEQAEAEGFTSHDGFFWESEFEKRSSVFRTAGNQAREFLKEIEKKAAETPDDNLREALEKLASGVEYNFVEVVKKMKKYLSLAERAGPGAREEVEILFNLFAPSQYRHIESYLKEFYGDIFNEALTLNELGEFTNVDQLQQGVDEILREPEKLDEELAENISDNLLNFDHLLLDQSLKHLGADTLAGIRKLKVSVAQLIAILKNGGVFDELNERLKEFSDHAVFAFMDLYITNNLANEFSGLKGFYDALDEDEKSDFSIALKNYVMDFIGEDLELDDTREIMNRPMWKEFESIGIDGALKKIILR